MKSNPMDTSKPSGTTPVTSPAQLKPPRSKKIFKPDKMRMALMSTLEKLNRQDPESLPFRQPVDSVALQIHAKKAYEEEESDFEDEMLSGMSRDPEMSFPKLSTPKKGDQREGKSKGKKSKFKDDISDNSDFVTPKKKKRFKSKILDANISDSNSKEEANGKKGAKKGKSKGKRKAEDSSDEDTYTGNRKSKDKKRRRIKRMAYSDEHTTVFGHWQTDLGNQHLPHTFVVGKLHV
ncbi:hypothetical protein DPMN_122616 [Dreissena polymorpha]|uniref:Uncharacterized protein n=1 Tax=Dreissena polymorpha TaxID=45954 RepID=A0A9D4JUN0_DREPO|nr:hypothetical protein DPMN_122616 [Dreissena polymorpha]